MQMRQCAIVKKNVYEMLDDELTRFRLGQNTAEKNTEMFVVKLAKLQVCTIIRSR